tara:strand:- start:299 stop:982 length:684 start_codon:yes stop_codon:yes gene_type:complete
MKNILILGRGKSLKYISRLRPEDYDLCFIVNNFQNEIEISHDLLSFLTKSKKLIQIVGRDRLGIMNQKYYNYLKIENVVLNVLREEYFGSSPFNHQSVIKSYLDSLGIQSSYLPKQILKYCEYPKIQNGKAPFPTTGICCLGYVLSSYRCKSITTLGIDFYKSDYFHCSIITNNSKPTESQFKKGDRMIDHMIKLVEVFNDVDFRILTSSGITNKKDIKNLTIKNLK